MDNEGPTSDLVSVAEAATMLERSTEQVRRYLREQRLAGRRVGGQWFIERAAVMAFSGRSSREERFLKGLRPANQTRPLDDVIAIGEGPAADISAGKRGWWLAAARRR